MGFLLLAPGRPPGATRELFRSGGPGGMLPPFAALSGLGTWAPLRGSSREGHSPTPRTPTGVPPKMDPRAPGGPRRRQPHGIGRGGGATVPRPARCATAPTAEALARPGPTLAGQPVAYLDKQLRDFRSGARSDPTMTGMVAGLDAQAIADLSAWFASQPLPPAPPHPHPRRSGPRGVPRRRSGPRGWRRAEPATAPTPPGGRTRGATRSRPWPGSGPATPRPSCSASPPASAPTIAGAMMQLIASRLNAEEIEAVAAYLSSLGAPEGAP